MSVQVDTEDDDDTPISELMKKRNSPTKSKARSASDKGNSNKRVKPSEEASTSNKKEPKSAPSLKKPSGREVQTEQKIFGLDRMDKHNVVSAILRRWNYCLDEWPSDLPSQPPKGFMAGHVKGLYVGQETSVFGQLKDVRPFTNGSTPSMKSLLSVKTAELREILMKGIEKQKLELGDTLEDRTLKDALDKEYDAADKLKYKKIERKYQEALQAMEQAKDAGS